MFDSLQIYCQKVNYLNQKQICTYFKVQGWYLLLKKKHLPLCLEHKGRKEKKKGIRMEMIQFPMFGYKGRKGK